MQLLVVRHADAGDAAAFAKSGQPDSERPLSDKGRRQMAAASTTLHDLVPDVALILSSPYVRAVQTAEIVRKAYGARVPLETSRALEPGARPDAFAALVRAHAADVVAIVGHEPHLGALVTWLVAGTHDSRVEMKKGGACLLEFDGRPSRGAAVLLWLAGPKLLNR